MYDYFNNPQPPCCDTQFKVLQEVLDLALRVLYFFRHLLKTLEIKCLNIQGKELVMFINNLLMLVKMNLVDIKGCRRGLGGRGIILVFFSVVNSVFKNVPIQIRVQILLIYIEPW